jgi:hypothetical protein
VISDIIAQMARVSKKKIEEPNVKRVKKEAEVTAAPAKSHKTSTKTQPGIVSFASGLKFSLPKPNLSQVISYRPTKQVYLALVVAVLLIAAAYNKSWFIAATVNGKPITNFELMSRMNTQYREQVLNQIVNEKILLNEAEKNHVVVGKKELDDREKQMVDNVGGKQSFETLLAQQGQTETSFRNQLEVWMTIEKLYDKDASVSADEVNKYIEQNKDQMQSTDSAKQKTEATDAIKQQKLGQIFNDKFQGLKQAAKVTIF